MQIRRGDIYYADLSPVVGSEQGGVRPVLVIQNGVTKLVNIKNQDGMTKILDMVPDFINKFTSGKDTDDIIDDIVSDDTDNE